MHLPILSFKHVSRLKSQIRDTVFIDVETQAQLMKSTSWADGLRGLATMGVVASHLTLCFARSLITPCCASDEVTPKLFQLPILRLVASGHSWVAVFFILMGFVNALKPLRLAQANQHEEALSNLSNSSMRRVFRLVLPATLTTFIAWLVCQLHFMERARHSNAWWLYISTPVPSSSLPWAISDLSTAIRYTWLYHNGDNIYSQPQWTMMPLLQGSLMLLLALLFTMNLTSTYRNVVLAVAAVWSINLSGELNEPLVGLTTLTGMLLSNVSLTSTIQHLPQKRITPYLSTLLILFGLTLMSVPSSAPENSPWSNTLYTFGQRHLPYPTRIETFRFLGSIGAIFFLSGVLISPVTRNILSVKPLTHLGRISFPVFLLHPIFMQTVMPWFAFQSSLETYASDPPILDEEGEMMMVQRHPQRGVLMIWLSILMSMSSCLVAAHYWVIYVEPVFGRVAGWCERVMTGRMVGGEKGGERRGRGVGREVLPVASRAILHDDGVHKVRGNGVLTPPLERSLTPPLLSSLESSVILEGEKEIARMA